MTRRLNLNNYNIVDKLEDASLVIVPFDIEEDKQPLLYLANKLGKKPVVLDTKDAVWTPTVFISKDGTPDEYCTRVHWWFDNATGEYKQQVQDVYRNIDDLKSHLKLAKLWLLTEAAYKVNRTGSYYKRKEDVNKFLRGWLNRSFEKQMRRR